MTSFELRRLLTVSVLALSLSIPGQVRATDASGDFLAARQAALTNDYRAAATYFTRALVRDPSNPMLLENAALSQLALGEVERAVPIAERMRSAEIDSQIANMIVIANWAKSGDFAAITADLAVKQRVGPLPDQLVGAWAKLGEGDSDAALAAFDAVAANEALMPFGLYHKALALAVAGDFEGADGILAGRDNPPLRLARRGVVAHAEILSQLERNEDAVKLIDESFGPDPDMTVSDLRARLVAGETVPFDIVTDATAGIGEVFDTIAGALNGESSPAYTLLYTRIAEYLNPNDIEATLLAASILEQLERWDLATEAYNRVPPDSPAFVAAELGRAEALRRSGNVEAALEALNALSRKYPDIATVHITIGDILRQKEDFEGGAKAYSEAIRLIGEPEPSQWYVFFARGICYERTDRWQEAEKDFRQALALSPDQPQVLNYMGYSFVEQKTNLDEALDMIQRAVAARPDDGYITDSLGWAFYRLGRYEDAVAPMERAVELTPLDPVITDHLGDVYWAVGRKNEARFQWQRALSFIQPDDTDHEANPDRIRKKLQVGLDEVLKEEGAPPLPISSRDG